MPSELARYRIERYSVALASGASLSFQRYLLCEGASFDTSPRSLGGLPCATASVGVMVPLPQEEGLWIACLPAPHAERSTLTVRQDGAQKRTTRVSAAAGTTLLALPGLRLGDGFSSIRRTTPELALRLGLRTTLMGRETRTEELALILIAPDRFEAETGHFLHNADPRHGFGGWPLP